MAETPRELSRKTSWKEKDLGVMYTVRSVGIRCQQNTFSWLDRKWKPHLEDTMLIGSQEYGYSSSVSFR